MRQTSVKMFKSSGSARQSPGERGEIIADEVRNRFVSIDFSAEEQKTKIDAIEHTYVYGNNSEAPVSMAHGYIVVLEGTALFVQHTSKKPVTSDLAGGMALKLVRNHFRKTGPVKGDGSISRVVYSLRGFMGYSGGCRSRNLPHLTGHRAAG